MSIFSSSFSPARRVPNETLAIRCTSRTFALRMGDESMRGCNIHENDIVVLEQGLEPRHGDVVAALVDNESLVRSYAIRQSRPVLEAAHTALTGAVPADGLVIQGVMVALIRHRPG